MCGNGVGRYICAANARGPGGPRRVRPEGHVVTADDFGMVKLFNYPCVVEAAPFAPQAGHCSHVACVRFSPDDALCISAGGHDRALLQFRTRGIAGYVQGDAPPPPISPQGPPGERGKRAGAAGAAGEVLVYTPNSSAAPGGALPAAPHDPYVVRAGQQVSQPRGPPPSAAAPGRVPPLAPVPESPAASARWGRGGGSGETACPGGPPYASPSGLNQSRLDGGALPDADAYYDACYDHGYDDGYGGGEESAPPLLQQQQQQSWQHSSSGGSAAERERAVSTPRAGSAPAARGAAAAARGPSSAFGSSGPARGADPAARQKDRLEKAQRDARLARAVMPTDDVYDAPWGADASQYDR